MTETHVEEELLHRYFDGELQTGEATSVRGHLTSCDRCTSRHSELSALRRMITVAAEQSTLDVDFDRAFGRIEREIGQQAREQGLLERVGSWLKTTLDERPERLWAPALGVAAAAALMFTLGRDGRETEVAQPSQPLVEPAVDVGTAAAAGADGTQEPGAGDEPAAGLPEGALAMASSEVVQVDFGGLSGTVFDVAVADGVSTPVIWINDDGAE